MKQVRPLIDSEIVTLQEAQKYSIKAHFRNRCSAIELSNRGYSVPEIARFLVTRDDTVYTWIKRWDTHGICGLMIAPGRGLKSTMSNLLSTHETLSEEIKKKLAATPQKLSQVVVSLKKTLDISISYGQLKKFIKEQLAYTWRRLKKWLKPKQDPLVYEKLYQSLQKLIQLEEMNYIDLYYGDQSSFSMNPNVPYGWQEKGNYLKIVPSATTPINVFGLLSRNGQLESYECNSSMTSEVMIAFIDDFAKTRKQKTVIVLDNAPIHKSIAFSNAMQRWKKQDLEVFFLPTYSPHLNIIETLWRKMKHEWLKPTDYLNCDTLKKAVINILKQYGIDFNIKFA